MAEASDIDTSQLPENSDDEREQPAGNLDFWALASFGIAVGLLTAVSQAAGTTTTLFGLLFAMIGGSLVSLFRPANLTREQLRQILRLFAGFCWALLLGLLIGFGAKLLDMAVLQPMLERQQPAFRNQQTRMKETKRWLNLVHALVEAKNYDELKSVVTVTGTISELLNSTAPATHSFTPQSAVAATSAVVTTQSYAVPESLAENLQASLSAYQQSGNVAPEKLHALTIAHGLVSVLEEAGRSEDLDQAVGVELRNQLRTIGVLDGEGDFVEPADDGGVLGSQIVAKELYQLYKNNFGKQD